MYQQEEGASSYDVRRKYSDFSREFAAGYSDFPSVVSAARCVCPELHPVLTYDTTRRHRTPSPIPDDNI